MKKRLPFHTVVAVALILAVSTADAEVPQIINYQGRLTDVTGEPVANGDYLITFTIWNEATATEPVNQLWTSGQQTVPVSDGLFTFYLGSASELPGDLFAADTLRYLGIKIGDDPEISPRTRLTSVGYAYQALRADTAAVALSGVGGWTDDGAIVRLTTSSDLVGIGTSTPNPAYKLDVRGGDRGIYALASEGTQQNRPFAIVADLNTSAGVTNGGGFLTELETADAPSVGYIYGGKFSVNDNGNKSARAVYAGLGSPDANDYGVEIVVDTPGYAIHSDGTGRLYFNGDVGVGTPDPTEKLDIDGTVRLRGIQESTGTPVVVDGNGVLWKSSSSKKYKKNIRRLDTDPEQVLRLQPVRYEWKTTGAEDIGLLAEDVAQVLPELVLYDQEGEPDGVRYDKIAVYLLEEVREQRRMIGQLQDELDELRKEKQTESVTRATQMSIRVKEVE